jgi:hypothetical protein
MGAGDGGVGTLKAAFKPYAETKLVWAMLWRSRIDRKSALNIEHLNKKYRI